MTPSPHQLAIWGQFQSGTQHLIVEALAGTGKTTTILRGLDYLAPGQDVVLTSFGRDICSELKERLPPQHAACVKTLHSLGFQALRQKLRAPPRPVTKADAPPPPPHEWLNTQKATKHIEAALIAVKAEELPDGLPVIKAAMPRLRKAVSLAKAQIATTIEQIARVARQCGVRVPQIHPDKCSDSSADVQDPSTWDACELLESEQAAALIADVMHRCMRDLTCVDFDDMIWMPIVHGCYGKQFDVVIVDEVQDFTPAQIQLVRMLPKPGHRIIAVGDSNQAIFLFRGAELDAVGNLAKVLEAIVLPLSVSFRCAQSVVQEAQKSVPAIQSASGAPKGAVKRITANQFYNAARPGDLVVSRINARLAEAAGELRMSGFPVKTLGTGYLKALLKLIDGRRPRTQSIVQLMSWLDKKLKSQASDDPVDESPGSFSDMVETIRTFGMGHEKVRDLVADLREIYIDTPSPTCITLSTVHRAKGKEADRVFVLTDTFFLPRGHPQEEENIYYVAVTRAKTSLFLVGGAQSTEDEEEDTA